MISLTLKHCRPGHAPLTSPPCLSFIRADSFTSIAKIVTNKNLLYPLNVGWRDLVAARCGILGIGQEKALQVAILLIEFHGDELKSFFRHVLVHLGHVFRCMFFTAKS